MKKGILFSAMMAFALAGFSQTATTSSNAEPSSKVDTKHCSPEAKAACCAHAAKACDDKSASTSADKVQSGTASTAAKGENQTSTAKKED